VVAGAEDKTAYNFTLPGNAYGGISNYTITWLAERYDRVSSYGDHPLLGDSIYDTCQSFAPPKDFVFGPYSSTQEMSLYWKLNSGASYDARIANPNLWLISYSEHYMDSVGCSRESLYVHIADTHISITNADGTRDYSLVGLPLRKKRFSYQYWNNTASDTGMYPGGYVWLANGMCDTTCDAIAYAFMRHFIQDSANYGDGTHRYTTYFADNQYRYGNAPRLPSYYTINYSYGGPTSGMDWMEIADIESNPDSLQKYYDKSTLRIDSAITHVMDSVCDANGLRRVSRSANVDKGTYTHNSVQINYTGLNWELSYEYLGSHWDMWRQKMKSAKLVRDAPTKGLVTEWRLDLWWNDGEWYTKDRMCYGAFAWFLTFQDTTIYASPMRWTDTTKWHSIFELDIGDPIPGTIDTTDATGSGSTERRVIRRKYINGGDTALVLFRTGYGGDPGAATDPTTVSLGADYYYINPDGDTAVSTVSSISLYPMQGWIGVQGQPSEQPPSISGIGPTSALRDEVDTAYCTIIDDYGVKETWAIIIDTAGVYDTIHTTQYDPVQTSIDYEAPYTWVDSGNHWILFVAADDSGNTTRDSLEILVDVSHVYPVILNIAGTNPYEDSTGTLSADITDNDSVHYVYCWVRNPSGDSIHVGSAIIADNDTSMNYEYTWTTTGTWYMCWRAIDFDPASTTDSEAIFIGGAVTAEGTKTFNVGTGMIDAHGRSTEPDTKFGASIACYSGQLYYHAWWWCPAADDSLDDTWNIDSGRVCFTAAGQANAGTGHENYMYLAALEQREWDQADATWNDYDDGLEWQTPGGDIGQCISDTVVFGPGTHADGTGFSFKIHDNTHYGETWLDSLKYPLGNHGFALVLVPYGASATGAEHIIVYSTEEATESRRPYMEIYPSSEAEEEAGKLKLKGICGKGIKYDGR